MLRWGHLWRIYDVTNNLIFTSSQVEGKGSIDGSGHNLSGGMNGAVNGTGNSQLVGAQNLQSNRTGTNTSQLFGTSLLLGQAITSQNVNHAVKKKKKSLCSSTPFIFSHFDVRWRKVQWKRGQFDHAQLQFVCQFEWKCCGTDWYAEVRRDSMRFCSINWFCSAANGGNKNMTVQNGLQVNDNKGGTREWSRISESLVL